MSKYTGYDGETYKTKDSYIEHLEDYINTLYAVFDGPYDVQGMIDSYLESENE